MKPSSQVSADRPYLFLRPAMVLLAVALALGASPATAGAQASGLLYELRVHTCNLTASGTEDSVHLTLQAGGRLAKVELDIARERNSNGSYKFAWPAAIGGPSQLEQIKLELDGEDKWCFDNLELRYANQRVWQWTSSQDYAGRAMVIPWPTKGPIWLAPGRDDVAEFVRFADLGVSNYPDSGASLAWYEQIYASTCSATTSLTAGTNASVDITVMHDRVGDIISLPAGTFANTSSKASSSVGGFFLAKNLIFSFVQSLDWISVTKHGGDDWCMEMLGYLTYSDVPVPPESWERIWAAPRLRFGAGTSSTRFNVNQNLRGGSCFPICGRFGCTKCDYRYQGLPLQKGDFNANLAKCAEAAETCNGRDDNCDGMADEGLPRLSYFRDADGDRYGSSQGPMVSDCRAPNGYVTTSGDCNDAVAAVYPAATEACNGVDDNCNSRIDEGVLNACGSCGAVPVEQCNGLDDNCNGLVDDGFSSVAERCNGADDNCNGSIDENAVDFNACGKCGPLTLETCNGLDDDCDGVVDDAATDVNSCGVCGPLPTESCNLRDDDCDGQVDEGISRPTYCGLGVCLLTGAVVCVEGAERDICTPGQPTGDDADCNGVDDDCDGEVDEHFTPELIQCLGTCGTGFVECRDGVLVNSCEACEG